MLATFSFSVNRNCENMASRSFSSEQKSARGVKKNHHKDNWLMAAATRSSDVNIRQSADCWRVGVTGTKKCSHGNGLSKHFFRSCFFLLLEKLVFSQFHKKNSYLFHIFVQFLRICVFDFSELVFFFCFSELVSCHVSRPSLVLCSLPPSNFILQPSSTTETLSERVKLIVFPCSRTISRNSPCCEVRSSRTNTGGLPALVLDDLTVRHDELCDYAWQRYYFDTFAQNFLSSCGLTFIWRGLRSKRPQTGKSETRVADAPA